MTYDKTFRRFAEIFGIRRERANLPRVAEAACKEGIAVIPVLPGKKIPMCPLTAAEKKKADAAAQEAARELGKVNWEQAQHDCGRNHAITDPKEARRVFTRLLKQGDVNIGMEPGKSGWLVVDADQAQDVAEWMDHWADRNGDEGLRGAAPTVSSPGVKGEGSEWKHKGGGHIYYWLPEGVSFANSDVHLPMPYKGSQVYFNDGLVLLPPSMRPEGEYFIQSDCCQAPDWLVDEVIEFVEKQTEVTTRQSTYDGDSPIDKWAIAQPWDELLLEDGWTFSHKVDKCSCPIWTRPGEDRGSYKSATAHDAGCLKFDINDSPGFLHLWTDNPPQFLRDYIGRTGKKSISKFNFLAWRNHAGDTKLCYAELGLETTQEDDYIPGFLLSDESTRPVTHTTYGLGNGSQKDAGQGVAPSPVTEENLEVFGNTESEEQTTQSNETPPAEPPSSGETGLEVIKALLAHEPDEEMRRMIAKEIGAKMARKRADEILKEADTARAELDDQNEVDDVDMDEAFTRDWGEEEWLLDNLLTFTGKALFTAPAKAGKTTTMGSLVYALSRATPFLGHFGVEEPQNVYIVDTEMTPRKHVEWLKSADIDPSRVKVAYLRGQAHKVDLRSEANQIRWSRRLREAKANVLILDPLSPVLAGLGLDENSAGDVQAFLAGVDAIITGAGLHGAIVVHHHGHSGERGRGSSAFLGWPDAIWTLVKDDNNIRYFAANGRDIEVPESALDFDEQTRRVSIPDLGARRTTQGEVKKSARDSEVLAYIRGNAPISGRGISDGMEVPYETVRGSLERLELAGSTISEKGPKNSKLWRAL